jgi:prephenate dehydratase
MAVGFQGEPGAFSEEAAAALFGEVETRGYVDFDALIAAVDNGEIEYGLLPCENSIHGQIARAYDLLFVHPNLRVVDETVHRIVQNCIGVRGASTAGLTRIESHPVALEQCRRFIGTLPGIEVVAVADTAGAVRDVIARGDARVAALGPAASATRYGGAILAEAVQDETENFTRFFLVARGGDDAAPRRGRGRALVALVLPHRPGSLHAALGYISEKGLNLLALLPRPLPGRPFEYVFYAELDCPDRAALGPIAQSIDGEMRVLGWY